MLIGRLVEKKDLRRMDQRAGEPELLLHAPGEVAPANLFFEGSEIAEGEEAVDFPVPFPLRDTVDIGIENGYFP